MRKFDVRKVRKLGARERYSELYFHFREAEHMIASNFPGVRRHGRRLKRRVERLYQEWFSGENQAVLLPGYSILGFAG